MCVCVKGIWFLLIFGFPKLFFLKGRGGRKSDRQVISWATEKLLNIIYLWVSTKAERLCIYFHELLLSNHKYFSNIKGKGNSLIKIHTTTSMSYFFFLLSNKFIFFSLDFHLPFEATISLIYFILSFSLIPWSFFFLHFYIPMISLFSMRGSVNITLEKSTLFTNSCVNSLTLCFPLAALYKQVVNVEWSEMLWIIYLFIYFYYFFFKLVQKEMSIALTFIRNNNIQKKVCL